MTRARASDPEPHPRFTNERWSIRDPNIWISRQRAAGTKRPEKKNGGRANVDHVDHVRVKRYRAAHCTFGRPLSLLDVRRRGRCD